MKAGSASAMYAVIADWVAGHLGADAVTVTLLSPRGDTFEVASLQEGVGLVPQGRGPGWSPVTAAYTVPLLLRGTCVGALTLRRPTEDAVPPAEQAVLARVGVSGRSR